MSSNRESRWGLKRPQSRSEEEAGADSLNQKCPAGLERCPWPSVVKNEDYDPATMKVVAPVLTEAVLVRCRSCILNTGQGLEEDGRISIETLIGGRI